MLCLLLAGGQRLRAQSVVATDTVGTYPAGIAVNPATNTIYITNHDSNTVSVINGANNTVIAAIPVGNHPMAIGVNPVTNTVYVGNYGETTVSVISGVTNAVTATLTAGTNPAAIAVDSVANIIYVADWGSNQASIINGATNAVTTLTSGQFSSAMASNPVTTMAYSVNYNNTSPTVSALDGANASITNITSPLSVGPLMVALNPITNTIYAADGNRDYIEFINGATNTLTSMKLGVKTFTQSAIMLNPVTNFIYIANQGSNSVTVINGATQAVVSNLTVGTAPGALAINTQTNTIYVANNASYSGTTINVINGATATTAAIVSGTTYTVGAGPLAMAVNPVTNTLYVANAGSPTTRGTTVSVIDLTTNTVSAPMSVGANPVAAVVNPATNEVYVANSGSNSVSVINGLTNAVTSVMVGSFPKAVAINPGSNTIYVANQDDGTVSEIDGATATVSAAVTVGRGPQALAVNPITNSVYVANTGGSSVSVINGSTVSTTVTVGATPQAVAVNPATNTIYVANYGSGTMSAINGTTNAVTSLTVGATPQAVAVNPATNTIYVANYGDGTVSVINGTTNAVSSVTVGSGPYAVTVNPATNTIYVANQTDGTVSVINGATNTVSTTVTVGPNPYALTVNSLINTVYVANQGGTTISVINGATNIVSSVTVGTGPQSVVVNPATGQVYVPNFGSGTVSVITPANINAVPLTTDIAAVSDANTISTVNIFQTTNPTPSFTTMVTSAYTSSSSYSASTQTPSPVNPKPTALYYQVNGGSGVWQSVFPASSTNPATFTVTPAFQQLGLNTLYVYAAYGSEGTSAGAYNQTGNSPEIGNITALQYLIEPVATTTTLAADHTSQAIDATVNLTASVTPASSPGNATGSVTFTSTSSAAVVTTLCSNVAVVYSAAVTGPPAVPQANQATCAASFSAGDTDTITATFTGAQNFSSSSGTLSEMIGSPVSAATSVSSATLTESHLATAFSPVTGMGGTGTLTYTVLPALPMGLSFSTAGVVSGTPTTTSATTTYTVTVTDANSATAMATFSLTVSSSLSAATSVSSMTLTESHLVTTFSPVTGTGGTGMLAYSVLPALPTGLSLSTAGVVSGTPTSTSAATTYTVTVTDANSTTATATFRLTVDSSVVATQAMATTNLTVNQTSVAFTPVAGSGGSGSVGYSVFPTLPAGLSFASSTGTITGTPTVTSATATYTVTVTDTNNANATANFSLTVDAEVPTIIFTVPNHVYGDAAFRVNASSNSTGAFTYLVVSGPATTSGSTVTLSGAGTVTLQASEAADTNYSATTKNASFTISTAALTIKANDSSRLYGAVNSAFTGSVSGTRPGDNLVESFTTSATTLSPVATYAIVPSMTGPNVSSYTENVVNGTLTISQAPTSITLSASSTSITSGQYVTFTVQVLPSTSGTPTGIVTVLDNGEPSTTLTLTGGSASYSTAALSPGIAHVLTATYAGDGNFLATTAGAAATTTVAIGGTDTAITSISGASFTVVPGGALDFDLLLTPQPGAYPGPVTFTITGLPAGATATFTPPSLSAVTSPITVKVTIQTVPSVAKLIRMHGDMGAIALGLLLLPIGFDRRTRKQLGKLSLLAILLGSALSSMLITGCGSGGFFRQKPQNYTLTITATSGQVKHAATITLNIQ
jgi:YVTN family beta-propeller protein